MSLLCLDDQPIIARGEIVIKCRFSGVLGGLGGCGACCKALFDGHRVNWESIILEES
jgi:hypothetical protein